MKVTVEYRLLCPDGDDVFALQDDAARIVSYWREHEQTVICLRRWIVQEESEQESTPIIEELQKVCG